MGLFANILNWLQGKVKPLGHSPPYLEVENKETWEPFLEENSSEVMLAASYDKDLLECAHTQWQFGDWESLARIERESLYHHPQRARLALLVAAGHQQQGNTEATREFTLLAKEWGASKKMISQVLIAGVYNTLGKASALCGQQQRAIGHFEASVATGTPGGDLQLLGQARAGRQMGIGHLAPSLPDFFTPTNTVSKQHPASKGPVFLNEGYEACIYSYGNQVFKVYKSDYFQYNKDYKRKGEGSFLKANSSKFFITLLQETPFYIVMPYAGERIGDLYELDHKKFNNNKLYVWLLELQEELNRLAIKHRDINPSNILYHRARDEFRLIDFGWAIGADELDKESLKPEGMNPYGSSDDESIEKMIASVTQYLSEGIEP